MPDPRAETILEAAIRLGRSGGASTEAVLWALAASTVVVLTPRDPSRLRSTLRRSSCTATTRPSLPSSPDVDRVVAEFAGGRVPVSIPAELVVRSADAQVGIVVNPGSTDGFEVPAAGLAIGMPLESDLEEISEAQAAQVMQMVAERSYRPLT